MGAQGRRRGGQGGLTLVELVIALGVLAMVLAMGAPFLQRWKEEIDLRSAAARVGAVMLDARTRAIVERRTYTVSVDYANDSYSVAPVALDVRKWGSVDLHADTSDPDCRPLGGQNVAFLANGTADAAGYEAVYLRNKSGGVQSRYRVKVLGATGRVTLEKWKGGEWAASY